MTEDESHRDKPFLGGEVADEKISATVKRGNIVLYGVIFVAGYILSHLYILYTREVDLVAELFMLIVWVILFVPFYRMWKRGH
jgi:hypothetical protein